MRVIIQCAASKQPSAGKLRTQSGAEVFFVANPELCPSVPLGVRYVRPDDICEDNAITWREVIQRYNEDGKNPFNLCRAGDLYLHRVYRLLTGAFGWQNVFILSAGWGLVRSDFLIPDYDITFTGQAKKENPCAWRNAKNAIRSWSDFNHLRDLEIAPYESIHLFGSKAYLPTFYELAESVSCDKFVVHHKGKHTPLRGFEYIEFMGRAITNWHYPAATLFVDAHRKAESKQ